MSAFLDHGRLLRHSLLLLAASQVGNLAGLLYQIFLMRRLAAAEYGIAAAMFGMIVIICIPLDALRTALAYYAARYCQAGNPGRVRGLAAEWSKILAGMALAVLAGITLSRFWLAEYFHLPSSSILFLVGAVLAGSLFIPLFAGALQGVQAFGWWAISTQSWAVVRLLAGIGLVLGVEASALMALLGQGMGVLACVAIGWLGLFLALRGKPHQADEKLSGGGAYFLKSFLPLAAYAILANADVCMVKHYFAPDEAGVFARAANIARGIVFLAMPIAGAMFPKVVSEGGASADDRRMLLRALGFAAALIGAACLGASLLAGPIWLAFVGQWPAPAELSLLRMVLWAMAPLGLVYLMLNFELAQHRFGWAWLAIIGALAYVGGVGAWHQTLPRIVAVMAMVNGLTLAAFAIAMPWKKAAAA